MRIAGYYFTCKCGQKSPRTDSREAAREWHARHVREDCDAPRGQSQRSRLDWGDLAELQAHAERLRPIDPLVNVTSTSSAGWRDASVVDSWGRRQGGQALWTDGNCLKACIATLLQWKIESVPDPTEDFVHEDWLERFDKRLATTCGVRLEKIPRGGCPPADRRPWIAVVDAGSVNHAVLVRNGLIYHDPNGHELNGLPVPSDRLLFGLRLEPANAPKRDRWGKAIR
jgi:hypothetical protein